MNNIIHKPLSIQKADYYDSYKDELFHAFAQHILPLKFCTLFPELLHLYREREALLEEATLPLRESMLISLFDRPSIQTIFPEKNYVVCALASGKGSMEERVVHTLRKYGKKIHFMIQDSSVATARETLQNTTAEWGIVLDIIKHYHTLRAEIDARYPGTPVLFLLLGFTFSSLSHYKVLDLMKTLLRPTDRLLIDAPIFEGEVLTSHTTAMDTDHVYTPLLSLDLLKEVAHFYGVPRETPVSFHTQFDEKPLFGGYRKNIMIRFEKPCKVKFKDTQWTYQKGEALSLFRMQFFGLDDFRTFFQRTGFEEHDYITLPAHHQLSASLHIFSFPS